MNLWTKIKLIRTIQKLDMKKLRSRKLWAFVITAALTAFGEQIGMSPDAIHWLVGLASSYLIGQGIADHGKTE